MNSARSGARALVIFTPGGLERMFEEGGVPAGESAEPPGAMLEPWTKMHPQCEMTTRSEPC